MNRGSRGRPKFPGTVPHRVPTSPKYTPIPFRAHAEKCEDTGQVIALYQTITFQHPYQGFSFEELRLLDYAHGRGYRNANGQAGAFGAITSSNPFGSWPIATSFRPEPLRAEIPRLELVGSPTQGPETHPVHLVQIFHPAYLDDAPLLTLHALKSGTHHATTLTACQIVAGNRWDGFLSETRDGTAVTVPLDAELCGSVYYFQVPGEFDYPVVPRFSDWPFPHNDLPPAWANFAVQGPYESVAADAAAVPANLDNVIRPIFAVPDDRDIIDLVPKSERDWFFYNCMNKYVLDATRLGFDAMDDAANQIHLRQDLHSHFERGAFVIAPHFDSDTTKTVPVTHVLGLGEASAAVWHNGRVQLPQRSCAVPVEYLLARFAWAFFRRVTPFLTNSRNRSLIVRSGNPASPYAIVTYDGGQCAALVGKSSETQDTNPDDDDDDDSDSDSDSDSDDDSDSDSTAS